MKETKGKIKMKGMKGKESMREIELNLLFTITMITVSINLSGKFSNI